MDMVGFSHPVGLAYVLPSFEELLCRTCGSVS
jgi:hypothetical protein